MHIPLFVSEIEPVEQVVRGDEEDGHGDHEAHVPSGGLFIGWAGRVDAPGRWGRWVVPEARYA